MSQAALLRWTLSLLGTLLPCGILWFLGPLLPQLEEPQPRLAGIAAALVLWAAANLLLDWRRRRRDQALVRGLASSAEADEAAAVEGKLASALQRLSKGRGKRGYLYQQPWYAIIGPPGAGKTTALLNAGLRFPLAEAEGKQAGGQGAPSGLSGRGAVAGVGGTRHCDWWFTDDAVLIDTAGRYTTQDSDAAVDRAGWEAFLALLKRTRPRQPLNGVLVAFALDDVVRGTPEERLAHARAVRRRIEELESGLGVRMPVYVLLTKMDLLSGFTEFFDDLDRERRAQVWGTTFPFADGRGKGAAGGTAALFPAEFRLLAERLGRRMFDRLEKEPTPERRAAISAFPAQFASLEAPLSEFLAAAFGDGHGAGTGAKGAATAGAPLLRPEPGRAPLLRGVYFTSATQEGTPFDRLTGAMARAFGLDQRRAPRLRPEEGRTYFLTDVLRKVVFGEAMLVAEPPAARRRRALLRAGAFAAIALLAAGGVGLVLRERARGGAEIAAAEERLAAYERTAGTLQLDPVADADLPALLPLLDQAGALEHGAEVGQGNGQPAATPPVPLLPVLEQEAKLLAAGRGAYRHALEHALLPRLLWRLEAQLRGNLTRPDFLYEATRIYLMLGGAGPLDRDLVREWTTADWEVSFPGEEQAALRAGLARHRDALLAEPLPPVPLDGELVAQARATFGRVSLAQRAYSRIRPSAAAQRLPPWKPSDALGPAGVQVFVRASGKPLSDGVPGFLTPAGLHQVLLPALAHAAQDVASESWVLGQRIELVPNSPEMRAIEQEVLGLYVAEYVQAWDALLADLDVTPLRSLSGAAQDLFIVASPQHSPMRALLADIARQLGPAAAGPAAPAAPKPSASQSQFAGLLAGAAQAAQPQAQAQPTPAVPARRPAQEVDDRYKALRTLMGADLPPGSGAPIDQALKPLGDLQQALAKQAAQARSSQPTPAGNDDPALAVRAEGLRQPQPLGRWLTAIAASGTALRTGDPRKQIVAAWNAGGGPASQCPVVVARYPFVANAPAEASMEEFARLFAPGAALDGFFNTQLKPYVDTSGGQWRPKEVEGVSPPVTQADLAQFQRAAQIRDRFFAGGSGTPLVRFDVLPGTADAGTQQAFLDLGDVVVAYEKGAPARQTQVAWPGAGRMQRVGLNWTPPPAREAASLQETGPWALFRLFARARIGGTGDKAQAEFRSGERRTSFELRAGTVPTAFSPELLRDFRCPKVE